MRIPLAIAILTTLSACQQQVGERFQLTADGATTPARAGDPLQLQNVTLVRQVETNIGWDEAPLCETENERIDCDLELEDAEPRIVDVTGAEVEVLPLLDRQDRIWAWTVSEPGAYSIVGLADIPAEIPLSPPIDFQVADWGEASDFAPGDIAGKTYSLVEYHTWPFDAGESLAEVHGPLFIEFSAVDGQQATMRAVARQESGDCVLLRARGELDRSTWTWEEDLIQVEDATAGDITIEDTFFEAAWKSGGADIADVRGSTRFDTVPLGAILSETPQDDDVCDLYAAVGGVCTTCETGSEYCIELDAYGGRLEAVDEVFPQDLPLCGLDLDSTGVSINCDFDLGCSSAGRQAGAVFLLPLVVMLRRRRR